VERERKKRTYETKPFFPVEREGAFS